LGDSSKMQVGDKVVAIGNALGQFQNTVTEGILSGFGRSVTAGDSSGTGSDETLQNLFQTDAAINEGNSGGPLVNINGEVIGINTAIAGDAQNIGFAIPINDAQGSIKSILGTGKLERPYLGVRYISLTDDYAYTYNLPVKRGAYIPPAAGGQASIVSGSPADKAGLKEKDVITAIDDTKIDENNSLTSVLGKHAVGDNITLSVLRGGKDMKIKVTLEAAPGQ
jgi:serine protease Do